MSKLQKTPEHMPVSLVLKQIHTAQLVRMLPSSLFVALTHSFPSTLSALDSELLHLCTYLIGNVHALHSAPFPLDLRFSFRCSLWVFGTQLWPRTPATGLSNPHSSSTCV